jgi:hypothetical protein
MKPQTLLRLSLIIPYLLWGISTIIMLVVNSVNTTAIDSNSIISALIYVPILYAFGIVIWGIPYTLLAVGLWLWSRGKSIQKAIKVFALAPIMLAILIAIEISAFSINWSDMGAGFSQNAADFGASILAMGGLAIVFGYLSIGVVTGIYKVLTMLNFIKKETEMINPVQDTLLNQTKL